MSQAAKSRDLIYGNIDTIMSNAQKLRAEETVTLDRLLNSEFVKQNTDLENIEQLFQLAGQTEVSEAALEAIPDDVWQDLVTSHSRFETWDDMFTAASQSYVRSRLLDGIEQD